MPHRHAIALAVLGLAAGWGTTPARAADSEAVCRPSSWRLPAEGLRLEPRRADQALQLTFEADRLNSLLGREVHAMGNVHAQRQTAVMQADDVRYDVESTRVLARGHVQLLHGANRYEGTELDLVTDQSTGHFLQPRFHLALTDAGGRAQRADFFGPQRMSVDQASYSSCKVGDDETPPWVLTARRLRFDFEANEGIAEGAVLRFYGVPLLAMPVMSFPVTSERKSGWLPPSIDWATNSGLTVAAPYYWNIAPNQDATIAPTVSLKRGAGAAGEYRYLLPGFSGETQVNWLPDDQVAGTQRWAARQDLRGQGQLPVIGAVDYQGHWLRVSDADYWSDGLRGADNLTPRLLGSEGLARQRSTVRLGALGQVDQLLYAGSQHWQVLQPSDGTSTITTPYHRAARMGARWRQQQGRLDWSLETEYNRFSNIDASQSGGQRAHMLASVAWHLGDGGWQLTPHLGLNAATYDTDAPMDDGRRRASRTVPTLSLDSAWTLDRRIELFGRSVTQTLEPRLLYDYTPWRDQSSLPLYDSAELDFNATTVFNDATFSGIDRVADAHRVTGGLITRVVDDADGAELGRIGIAQRYLLSDQRITADGNTLTQRASDVLVLGSTSAIPSWKLESTLRYSTAISRVSRSTASITYNPAPYRTLNLSYSLQREVSEQYAVGWQWPLSGRVPAAAARSGGSTCGGTLYGVGRIEYSKTERRVTDAIAGLEYDAGCWVGRLVAQRESTSTSAATTRLMLQLEFVGLSRLALGSNPLSVLKDNIPGYRLLRESNGRDAAPDPTE